MKSTFTILQKNLRAVHHAMASNDIRYYLQGVCFENNRAETRIIATDGHRLHLVIQDHGGMITDPVRFIMPAEMVKACLKAKAPRNRVDPEITISIDGQTIEAALPDGSSIRNTALDGHFPDYCRIIPSDTSFEPSPAVFNCSYLLDAEQGLKDYLELGKKQWSDIGLTPRGSSVGVLSVPGFIAVIMPMRADLTPAADLRACKPIAAPEKVEQTEQAETPEELAV